MSKKKKKGKVEVKKTGEKIEELYDDVRLPYMEDMPQESEAAIAAEQRIADLAAKVAEKTSEEKEAPAEEEASAEEETSEAEVPAREEALAEEETLAEEEAPAEEEVLEEKLEEEAPAEEEALEEKQEAPVEEESSEEKPEEEAPAEEVLSEEETTEEKEKQSEPEAIGDEEKQPEPEAIGDEEKQSEPEAIGDEEKQSEPEAIGDEEKQSEPEALGEEDKQPEAEKPVEEKELEEQAETGVIEAEEAAGQEDEPAEHDEEVIEQEEEPAEHDEEVIEQDEETAEQDVEAVEEYTAEDYAEYEYEEEPESEPLPPVKRRPRRKRVFKRYSVLIVPENSTRVKTYKVSALPFVIVGILILAVAAAGIAGVNYAIRHIRDLRNQVIALNANLVNVTNANVLLEADKETLENQLREANAKISTTTYFQEQAASLQAMDHIPSGLPLDGQASPPSEYTEENQYITFNTGVGAKIVATGAGTVKSIFDDNRLGHVVQVDHGNGYISVYYSPSEPVVKEGDTVIRGTILYIVQGDTETLTYQITYNDKYIDPATIMRIDG